MAMVEAVSARQGSVSIIDVGGTETYWRILPDGFLERHAVEITVVNLPGVALPPDHGPFRFVAGDGCALDMFEDAQFDIAHSNSVIEHVGDEERMAAFASEVHRVAPRYFVQTPDFLFPVEPHFVTPFFHWLPVAMRIWLLRHFDLGQWKRIATREEAEDAVMSARLLTRKRFSRLFPDAEIRSERFFGLPKSLIAVLSEADDADAVSHTPRVGVG